MKSTGTSADTITGWSVLFFFCSSPLSSSPYVCVWVLSLMTQRLWRHAVTADGRYLKKKKKKRTGRDEITYERQGPLPERERISGSSELIGKVTNCDRVVISHSLNSTLLYLTSQFHDKSLVPSEKKCRALLFFQRLHHRKPQVREPELFITITVRSFSGATGKLSVIWQRLYYSTPCGSVGVAFAQNSYEKKQRQGLVPRRRFLKPGSQSGGAKRQCG